MAQVVFLRGVNVGGHRSFRPTSLARELAHLDVVNIGAAGTLVVKRPISQAALRAEVTTRLPFKTEIAICPGREIVRLAEDYDLLDHSIEKNPVCFVSVFVRRPREWPDLPIAMPSNAAWLLKVVMADHRFVLGYYRRNMKAISLLGQLDRWFGVPATTRSASTMARVAKVLQA